MALTQDELDQIVGAVVRAVGEQEKPRPSWFARLRGWLADNPALVAAGVIFAVVVLVAGCEYGVQPGTVLRQMAHDYTDAQARRDLVEEHVDLGQTFLKVQNLEAARAEFKQALLVDPTEPRAQRGLFITNIYEPVVTNEFDSEVADKRLERLSRENNDAIVLMIRGTVFLNSGDFSRASKFYNAAIRLDPSIAEAYEGKADIASRRGNAERAIFWYRAAARLSPGNARYANNLAYAFLEDERYTEAREWYRYALSLKPDSIATNLDAGTAFRFVNHGDYGPALAYHRRGVDLLATKSAGSPFNRLNWFFVIGRHTSGKVATVFANDLPKKRYYARLELALTSYLAGFEDGARAQLRKAAEVGLQRADERQIRRIILDDVLRLQAFSDAARRRLVGFKALLDRS